MLLALGRAALMRRADLALENLALRHQFLVLRCSGKGPRVEDPDRQFWDSLPRVFRW